MSLIRQVWLLLLGTVALAFVGSVTISVLSTRDTLQTQLRLKNSDNATTLALALSQQKDDRALMGLLMAAQFDTGYYRRIRMLDAAGAVRFVRESDANPVRAPTWFVRLAPIESIPGVAQVSDGWRALGSVEVVSHTSFAHDALWASSLRTAAMMACAGVLGGLLALLVVRNIRRPLDAAVDQAHALVSGQFVTVSESRVPELQRLTRAMNSMVERVKAQFGAQLTLVETLRQQATCDDLTGLSNRHHFLAQLSTALEREDGTAHGGLVLLRLMNLAEVNRTLGHVRTDRVLSTIGQALKVYSDRVDACFVGRLNGSDFALWLPAQGAAGETAQALADALRVALAALGSGLSVVIGATEVHRDMKLAELMSSADATLALAESRGPFSVELGTADPGALHAGGEDAWRQRITLALAQGRARLVGYALSDASNQVVALECPLRIQLDPDGPFEVAARWLPLALRGRLTAAVDLHAVALALGQTKHDGRTRCVNISPASLGDSAFAPQLRDLLRTQPDAARQLWLEVAEAAAVEQWALVHELGRQVRPLGVRLGLEHAGQHLARVDRLMELGLDYIKLDASVVAATGTQAARASFVASTATMLHGLGMKVYAEGVADAADAAALWLCGMDGLTGPWVSAQRQTSTG